MKTFDIEIQRLKAARHDHHGMVELAIDALVAARPPRDEGPGSTLVRLSVDDARTLTILLKQQLAELDKLQPRSRRHGRA